MTKKFNLILLLINIIKKNKQIKMAKWRITKTKAEKLLEKTQQAKQNVRQKEANKKVIKKKIVSKTLLPKAPFVKILQRIIYDQSVGMDKPYRIGKEGINSIKAIAEDYLVENFIGSGIFSNHAKRKVINDDDLFLTKQLRLHDYRTVASIMKERMKNKLKK